MAISDLSRPGPHNQELFLWRYRIDFVDLSSILAVTALFDYVFEDTHEVMQQSSSFFLLLVAKESNDVYTRHDEMVREKRMV